MLTIDMQRLHLTATYPIAAVRNFGQKSDEHLAEPAKPPK